MTEFILFLLPSAVYFLVYGRRNRLGRKVASERLGAVWGGGRAYLCALILLIPSLPLGYVAINMIPSEVLSMSGASLASVTSVGAVFGVILRATGEEVFFRGFLCGVLVRRLGFGWGNLLQSVIFFIPHFTLLLVDSDLWPILPTQFLIGWVLGWLRTRTGSFLPAALIHVAVNIGAGFITL